MNEPYRLRYTNQVVGVFLLVFLVAMIAWFLWQFQIRSNMVDYYFIATEEGISGLNKGDTVMILGERAGEVKSIRYEEGSDRIIVTLGIDKAKIGEIFVGSMVSLERKYGVAGVSNLVIRRPKINGEQLKLLAPGSEITNFQAQPDRMEDLSQEVKSVSQSIRFIQQDLTPTLQRIEAAAARFENSLDKSVDPAFDTSEAAFDSFLETNETLRPDVLRTTETIRSATEAIDRVVEQDLRNTLGDVRETSDDLSKAAESVKQSSEEVNKDLAMTLEEMRDAIEQFRTLTEETREVMRIVRNEADDLPGTTSRVKDTVSDTQDLVGEIRSHWLLRNYSKQPTSTPQVSPSGVRGGSIR